MFANICMRKRDTTTIFTTICFLKFTHCFGELCVSLIKIRTIGSMQL